MKSKTQLEKIEDHLEEHGAISNFFAINSKLSLRLGARIFDLKEKGWDFHKEELRNKNTVYYVTRWREGKCPKGDRAKEMQHRRLNHTPVARAQYLKDAAGNCAFFDNYKSTTTV